MADRSISVVVAVYNAAASLRLLLDGLDASLRRTGAPFEVVLVNDGSRDDSWSVIETEAAVRPWVRGIDLSRNFGQHNALLCGIRAARHEIIVTMDDDLQNPPEAVPALVAALAPDVDVVYGSPAQEQHGLWRDIASQTTKLVLGGVLGASTARQVSGFRAFRTELRDAFQDYSGPSVNLDVLLTWATTKFTAIRIEHAPRRFGSSNYTFGRLAAHALNMLTGFSTLPLRIWTYIGAGVAAFAFAYMGVILVRTLIYGPDVPGYPSLLMSILFIGGVQLIGIGVLGEYLGRVYIEVKQRPTYIVGQTFAGTEVIKPLPTPTRSGTLREVS